MWQINNSKIYLEKSLKYQLNIFLILINEDIAFIEHEILSSLGFDTSVYHGYSYKNLTFI